MIPYYDIECLRLDLAEGTIAIHFTLFFFPKSLIMNGQLLMAHIKLMKVA